LPCKYFTKGEFLFQEGGKQMNGNDSMVDTVGSAVLLPASPLLIFIRKAKG